MSTIVPRATILLYLTKEDEAPSLRSRLEDEGFAVLGASSGSECEVALQEVPIAFAFVEVASENQEGLAVIRACKSIRPDLTVVVLSSNGEPSCRLAARAALADDFLALPVLDVDLEMRLAQLKQTKLSSAAFPVARGSDYESAFRPKPDGLVDALTGLPGAGALREHLDREFARSRRYGHVLTILTLGVDGLGPYNETHGQEAGDRALCLVADVLRSALRSPDIVARHSGDHFVVLATDTAQAQGVLLGNRLRAALRLESRHAEIPTLTVSIGVASSSDQESTQASDLLGAAARALLVAKSGGRDRCHSDS